MAEAGRPLIFETPEALETAIDAYFDSIGELETPSYEGISVHLGIARKTLWEYGKRSPEFSNLIERTKNRIGKWWLDMAAHNEINPQIAKLVMATHHGYSDKQRVEHEGDGHRLTVVFEE